MGLPALFVSAVVSACSCDVCHGYALFISGESNCNVIGEKNFPAKNGAGTVPPPQDGEYTVDDLKTALEESERSLHATSPQELTAGTMASDMTRTRAAETAGRARFFGH